MLLIFQINIYSISLDIQNCGLNGDNACDAHATCSDTDGSYTCECNQGYHGDGFTCAGECSL